MAVYLHLITQSCKRTLSLWNRPTQIPLLDFSGIKLGWQIGQWRFHQFLSLPLELSLISLASRNAACCLLSKPAPGTSPALVMRQGNVVEGRLQVLEAI